MKKVNDELIIGIDTGYGNVKTCSSCFPAAVMTCDTEPVFKENMLMYDGKYYLIGEGHKEFLADKTADDDYYILILAAIARELRAQNLTSGKIRIAAGLPLTWVGSQKESFRKYLLRNKNASFTYKGVHYRVEFVEADVFPQGFAGVADRMNDFKGVNIQFSIFWKECDGSILEPFFHSKRSPWLRFGAMERR